MKWALNQNQQNEVNAEPESLLYNAPILNKGEKAGAILFFLRFQTYMVQVMSLKWPKYMAVFLNKV